MSHPSGRRVSLRRRRRRSLAILILLVAVAVLVATLTSGGGPAKPLVAVRTNLPATAKVATTTGATSPGAVGTPGLPWPAAGEAAVDVPALGVQVQAVPEQQPVPVASLTKIMTAYVVLADHPIVAGSQGPDITVTAADAAKFGIDTVSDQSNVQLNAGEVLSEYQMLEGLLVHSANDLAYSLGAWDAGSAAAFVSKMNAAATKLGMRHTHFVDASGYQQASVSTAADILRVTAAAMAEPSFAQIVTMPAVTLPVAGTVMSYTPLLGAPGVVGVKSGYTTAAGGCDVLAYKTSVAGRTLVVLAAVTSQQGPNVLDIAGKEALAIAQAAASRVGTVVVAPAGKVVGSVHDGTRSVAAVTGAPVVLLATPGSVVRQHVAWKKRPRPGERAGTVVGTATFQLGTQVVSVPVKTAGRV